MNERTPSPPKMYMTTSRVWVSFYPYFNKVAKRKKSLGVAKCGFFEIQHTSKAQTTTNWRVMIVILLATVYLIIIVNVQGATIGAIFNVTTKSVMVVSKTEFGLTELFNRSIGNVSNVRYNQNWLFFVSMDVINIYVVIVRINNSNKILVSLFFMFMLESYYTCYYSQSCLERMSRN